MTPNAMAAIHKAAFTSDRPWNAAEFSDLAKLPGTQAVTHRFGFAMFRQVLDEVELLTLAVDPAVQRQGIARSLMVDWMAQAAQNGATSAFLEVAADNIAALSLYHSLGFQKIATRPDYYNRRARPPVDAIILQIAL
ncbi:MAG: ribosomal protein S18-alanine N-acetyltransferase [Sulfitobacter sp.]